MKIPKMLSFCKLCSLDRYLLGGNCCKNVVVININDEIT